MAYKTKSRRKVKRRKRRNAYARRRNPRRARRRPAMGYVVGRRPIRRRKLNRRRRRRNPVRVRRMARQYFGKARMTNALMLLVGLGGSGVLKSFATRMVPIPFFGRFYGAISIIVGATLNMRSRRKEMKSIGTGMVVFGLYDLVVSNVPFLQAYLPTIGAPSAFSGGMRYGRSVMGASMGTGGPIEVVSGTNISRDMNPEIVGADVDLADALEMAA